MARYVVIEFQSNQVAESFVEQVNATNATKRNKGRPFTHRVVGVFIKPGKICTCVDWERANSGDKNYAVADIVRGEKFGWWLCSRCSKPRRGGHMLRNQILPSETYEGTIQDDYEFGVTDLSVSGFHTKMINRPKKFRLRKKKVE